MAKKDYDWENGATLEPHSKVKFRILEEYFRDYLLIRCTPMSRLFRFAVVDGFAGGGIYKCGTEGSPLIFLKTLDKTIHEIEIRRKEKGIEAPIAFDCFMLFNDLSPSAFKKLKEQTAPHLAAIRENHPNLTIEIELWNQEFNASYEAIWNTLKSKKYENVLFNLDQCGHSLVHKNTLTHIMESFRSPEIFFTFAINTMLSYLSEDVEKNKVPLANSGFEELHTALSGTIPKDKASWLGKAENYVFNTFKKSAHYVSHFAINNSDGWYYWLIHFANGHYRARQAYNNVLHNNSNYQAHFGRSGLNMLAYEDGRHSTGLFLFDDLSREASVKELQEDIPRFISHVGNAMNVGEFRHKIYNITPAHSDDIDQTIIEHPEVNFYSEAGNKRRRKESIKDSDTIVLESQLYFDFL